MCDICQCQDLKNDPNPLIKAIAKNECIEIIERILKDSRGYIFGVGDKTYEFINGLNKDGFNAFHIAVGLGNLAVVRLLLEEKKIKIDCPTKYGYTALHLAIFNQKEGNLIYNSIIDLLLSKGANPNAKGEEDRTPLHTAVFMRNKSAMEKLFARNVNVNAKTSERDGCKSALHDAAYRGHCDIVKMLLSQGADVNALDRNNFVPLHGAVFKANNSQIANLLLNNVRALSDKQAEVLIGLMEDILRKIPREDLRACL